MNAPALQLSVSASNLDSRAASAMAASLVKAMLATVTELTGVSERGGPMMLSIGISTEAENESITTSPCAATTGTESAKTGGKPDIVHVLPDLSVVRFRHDPASDAYVKVQA